jgi:hypothetical protein
VLPSSFKYFGSSAVWRSLFPLPLVVVDVRENVPNVDDLPLVLDRRDQAIFVGRDAHLVFCRAFWDKVFLLSGLLPQDVKELPKTIGFPQKVVRVWNVFLKAL